MEKIKVGIIGPGNIGTDLMYKVMKSRNLQMDFMTGIVESEGLKRAEKLGFKTCILPKANVDSLKIRTNMRLLGVANVREALDCI